MKFYYGVVESREDPLKLGRCQVRVVGLHTHDKSVLPTSDLPWAQPMQPITSAAMNGIGWSPVGPVEGTTVIIFFADEYNQQPIMFGTVGGIPQSKAAVIATEDTGNIATDGGVISTPAGEPVKREDGSALTLGNKDEPITHSVNNVTGTVDVAANSIIKGIQNSVTAAAAALFGNNISSLVGTLAGAKKQTLSLPASGLADSSKPTIIPAVEKPQDAKITAQPIPGKADPAVLNTDINLNPIPKYVRSGETAKAKECITALAAACDKVGLTSKYAKSAILAIAGGETAWVPRDEGHVYSQEALLRIFPSIFKGNADLASEYSNGKKSKEEFFEFIYGNKFPKGISLGNKSPGDGGKYYGRGFNQLTGKSGYVQAMNDLKTYGVHVDLVNNPELLNKDIEVASLACAIFYKKNVKHPQDDPGYFEAARKRTGADASGGYEKKGIMYEYFLGQSVLASSTNKPSADKDRVYTPEEVAYLPKEKQQALLEDRSENSLVGFKDPKGKYPLRNLVNEPDTNRLARGVIKETAIAYKDQTRSSGIPAPFGATWEQPLAPFGGEYPYNKVYETESGHIQMFDDTPGNETISLYHRTGTFLDVDANGTQVNKIIGDGYTIIDRNGLIYIAGKCNLTVGNSVNIMVMGDVNLEVNGATQAVLHGQLDLQCSNDFNMSVGGDFNLQVSGNMNSTVLGSSNSFIAGDSNQLVQNDYSIGINGKMNQKISGEASIESSNTLSVVGDTSLKLSSKGNLNAFASAKVLIDGAALMMQQKLASPGASAVTAPVEQLSLDIASPLSGARDSFSILQTPVRPAPPVDYKMDLQQLEDFQKNPEKYYNAEAAAAGVNGYRMPQPDVGSNGLSIPPSGAEASDIGQFLTKQLALAKEGFWSETGMGGKPSNQNILTMWKDIGFPGIKSDQVAWCMAFVNWTLKQCNYRYAQSARAFDMRDKPEKWNATKVSEPQSGDIIVWSYSHVSFVWKVENGKIYPVGGNQGGGKPTDNNPVGGLVTQNYPNGISPNHPNIVGIYRPSKV